MGQLLPHPQDPAVLTKAFVIRDQTQSKVQIAAILHVSMKDVRMEAVLQSQLGNVVLIEACVLSSQTISKTGLCKYYFPILTVLCWLIIK